MTFYPNLFYLINELFYKWNRDMFYYVTYGA